MSLPRYSEYKDSGVEWLGEVPGHWHLDRLKRSIVSCKNGIWGEEAQEDENDIPCVRVADFNRQRLTVVLDEPTIRNVTEKERVGRVLSKGDLLLEKSGGGENQPVGCVVLYDDARPAVCSNFVAKMQIAAGMDSSYWLYVHAAAYAIRLTTGSINQTSGIQNLDQDRYFNERVAFPPFKEQQTIAAFLDSETGKIDALITEQRRLVELLAEKRQAVISHTVTKGLNPNTSMKDSGIEWLGEVPEHWEMKKIKQVSSLKGRLGWQGLKAEEYRAEGPFVVSSAHFDNFAIDWDVCPHVSTERYDLDNNIQLCEGDVLLMKDGAALGKLAYLAYLPDRACLNSHLLLFRPFLMNQRATYNPRFLFFLMRTDYFQEHINLHATGTTFLGISQEEIGNYRLVLPPLDEQVAIACYLDAETSKFDTLSVEANRAIELLKERRSALISAAVTGKLDVRGEQLLEIE